MEVVVKIPPDVQASKENDLLKISKGGKEIKKMFSHPRVKLELGSDKAGGIKISTESEARQDRAIIGTWASHIKNMIVGVTAGYEYKMKIVYTHFPITVKVVGSEVQISNFVGEKGIRKAQIAGSDTKVEVQKEIIVVTGSDVEAVGQTCANMERATHLARFDRRRFPDGLYLLERGVKGAS